VLENAGKWFRPFAGNSLVKIFIPQAAGHGYPVKPAIVCKAVFDSSACETQK